MALIICPKCNAELANVSKLCPFCGTSFKAYTSKPSSSRAMTPSLIPSFFSTFFEILVEPRFVFEKIIKKGTGTYTWPMLFTLGVLSALEAVVRGEKILFSLFMIPLIAGFGWLALLVIAWIYCLVGGWFGGKGEFADLFDFGVWGMEVSCFTRVVTLLRHLLMSDAWQTLWRVVGWGVHIWGFFFGIILLSVAHRYSWVRALGTALLLLAIVLVPLTLILWP